MDDVYKIWYDEGWNWILGAKAHKAGCEPFLRFLFDQGVKWPPLKSKRISNSTEDEWLNEILARAENLSSMLNLEPDWPSTFQLKSFIVSIFEVDDILYGWYENKSVRVLLAINLRNFQVFSFANGYEMDLATGVILSWFLDCCTCLRDSKHPHFELDIDAKRRKSKRRRWDGKTYRGTAQYALIKESTEKGFYRLPHAFRVKGHIRQLPKGHTPSDEARMNAPAYIRRNLESNETFVQGHSRSGYESRLEDLKKHLKVNSNLADAVGRLNL